MLANADTGADTLEKGGGKNLPNIRIMNAMNLRDTSRPRLSLRYGAIHTQRADRDGTNPNPMPTAELRRLVATMID